MGENRNKEEKEAGSLCNRAGITARVRPGGYQPGLTTSQHGAPGSQATRGQHPSTDPAHPGSVPLGKLSSIRSRPGLAVLPQVIPTHLKPTPLLPSVASPGKMMDGKGGADFPGHVLLTTQPSQKVTPPFFSFPRKLIFRVHFRDT